MSEALAGQIQSMPGWMESILSDQLGLSFVDRNGLVIESFGSLSNWLSVGQNVFLDVSVFVGLEEVFLELQTASQQSFSIDSFKLSGLSDDTRYSVTVNWVETLEQYCFAVAQQSWSGGIQDQILQESRKREYLQNQLEQERLRYERIYRGTPALMVAFNSDGQIATISQKFSELLVGNSETQNPKDKLNQILEGLVKSDLWSRSQAGQNLKDVPFVLEQSTLGMRELEISSFLMMATQGDGEQCYFVANDVTERNIIRQKLDVESENLELAYRELEQRNQELDGFASVASHDLQAPLRRISTYTEMLEVAMYEKNEKDIHFALDVLTRSAKQSRQLVEDILSLARLSADDLKLRSVALDPLCDSILTAFDSKIVELKADIHVDLAVRKVVADSELMRQILQNLISNALKYSSHERKLRIEITSVMDKMEGVVVTVADNGVGFHPHQAERVFQPFVRLSGNSQISGTGVGLAIAKKAAMRLNGSLDVTSRVGKGSIFRLRLPIPNEPFDVSDGE